MNLSSHPLFSNITQHQMIHDLTLHHVSLTLTTLTRLKLSHTIHLLDFQTFGQVTQAPHVVFSKPSEYGNKHT